MTVSPPYGATCSKCGHAAAAHDFRGQVGPVGQCMAEGCTCVRERRGPWVMPEPAPAGFQIGMIPCPHLHRTTDTISMHTKHPEEAGRAALISQQTPNRTIMFFMCRACWDELGAFLERWRPPGFEEQGGA